MAILLVRHGETASNAARVLQFPDTPLSERGLAQAERLASRLAERPVARILTSDYARARMTADAVRRTSGASLDLDPGLRERNFGELRGRPYAELESDPFAPGYTPPGGESWEDLHDRVDAVWRRVLDALPGDGEGDLVVVTHGLVCHSLAARHLSIGETGERIEFGNTSLTLIDRKPPFAVRLLACTAHLDAETAQLRRASLEV